MFGFNSSEGYHDILGYSDYTVTFQGYPVMAFGVFKQNS
jgi:hypothetical protein